MSQNGSSPQDLFTQLINLNFYMLKVQAIKDPLNAQGIIGSAIEHSRRNDGIDPQLLIEMFEGIFPGQPLPKAVSSGEFAEIAKRQPGNS